MAASGREGRSWLAVGISLKTVLRKRLAAELRAPLRDLTVRDRASRGPNPASNRTRRRARGVAAVLLASATRASLSAQRVRAAVRAGAPASPVLQFGVPGGGSALAPLAGLPDLSP